MMKMESYGTMNRETLALSVPAAPGAVLEEPTLEHAAAEESLLDDEMYEILEECDPWSEAIVSPCVHHNILTSEIRIPIPPTISTSLTSLTLHTLERCGSEERQQTKRSITPKIETVQSEDYSNEEVRCPREFDTLQSNPELSKIDIENTEVPICVVGNPPSPRSLSPGVGLNIPSTRPLTPGSKMDIENTQAPIGVVANMPSLRPITTGVSRIDIESTEIPIGVGANIPLPLTSGTEKETETTEIGTGVMVNMSPLQPLTSGESKIDIETTKILPIRLGTNIPLVVTKVPPTRPLTPRSKTDIETTSIRAPSPSRPLSPGGVVLDTLVDMKLTPRDSTRLDDDLDEEECDNTVIVSKLQELVIEKPAKHVTEFGMKTSVQNPLPPTSATCVKYKVHQSPNGVTTISIDPKAEPVTLQTPVPIIHHVINLPPRKVNSIRSRRRKAEEVSVSFGKSSRLSQLMMSDYRIHVDRPSSTNFPTGGLPSPTGLGNGFFEGKNVFKGNVDSMRRKVGSWYRKKVKTPVEQLSIDLGLDSVKFPIKLPFRCGSGNNGVNGTNGVSRVNSLKGSNSINRVNSLKGSNGVNRVNSLKGSNGVSRVNSLKANHKFHGESTTDSTYAEIDVFENSKPDQRFVEGLASDQGQNEFEELKRVVKQGGDFCKDLAAVLQERSELEATYAKGLSKLSAKLLKASKEATGSVAHAWQAVAVQIDTQAELHRIWSTALLDEIAKPLRNSTDTQHKIRKSVECLVEKTTRNLAEWRIAEAKAKRQCFSSSKEFEKIQDNVSPLPVQTASPLSGNGPVSTGGPLTNMSTTNLHSQANSVLAEVRARSRVLSLPPPDKDPIKLEAKRRKAEEAVRRADIEYYTFCVRSERARLEWEGAIRNGSTCLRTLEEEKLALLKELATKYFQHFNDFIPSLLRSSESLEEPIKTCSVEQDMHSVVDIRRHAGCEQLLPDFYAEDTANLMKKERRMEALQKFLFVIKQDLERERKGASSIEVLSRTLGDATPKLETAHHDLSDRLYYVKAMLLYLEGARTKIENAVADQEGRQRPHAAITQYMRHQRDKQGLPQTILKVPTWARDECLNHGNSSAADSGSGSAGSVSPDWRETKDHPAVHSNDHDHDDFDEFSSEGSENLNEDVFEETLSLPTSGDETGVKEPSTADLPVVPVPPLSIAPSIGQCRAIYNYESNMFDELTIKAGEILNVHDKQDDGWWLGELNGQVGIFPATYVEEISNT